MPVPVLLLVLVLVLLTVLVLLSVLVVLAAAAAAAPTVQLPAWVAELTVAAAVRWPAGRVFRPIDWPLTGQGLALAPRVGRALPFVAG